MKKSRLSRGLQAACAVALATVVVSAETTTFTTTFLPFPTGVSEQDGSLESMDPIPCSPICNVVLPVYYRCFVNTTVPTGGQMNQTYCDEYLCQDRRYAELSGCLNCIVANGNEKPFGYHTNHSKTAQETRRYGGPVGDVAQPNPNGLVDADQSNAILKNVTDQCASKGTSVTGDTTVTASPTTTGPYYLSWASGDSIDYHIWEGLTSYTDDLTALLITETFPPNPSGSGGFRPPTRTSDSGSGGAAASGPTSSAAAAASTSGAASPRVVSTSKWLSGSGVLLWLLQGML